MMRLRVTVSGFLLLSLVSALITLVAPTQPVSAAVSSDFKAGNIINDGIFFNPETMSVGQIQAFLNAKVPTCDTNGSQIYSGSTTRAQYGASKGYSAPYTCLKDYSMSTPSRGAEAGLCGVYDGGVKGSAQIIYDVAHACGINPQVLLVLLQKEQGLVTDDWPWSIQYQSATGFGCPDTAACDSAYYGFFNQVYNAGRIYRKYARDASQFNYIAGRNNNILYNPSSTCGSSSLYLENQATAGLYNYTPYQPNTAALANLYGTGDSCSAYGNRNFWRMFYDWFGSTTGGVSLIKSSSSATIYVLYGNQKQPIASLDVLNAWGLNNLPVTVMDSASINVFPTRSVLTRLAHNPYNSALYFLADGGGTYDSLSNMAANWGYNPAAASDIGIELIAYTKRLGGLSEFVTAPNAGAIFTVDGGTRRPFANPDTFQTWAGRSAVNMVTTDLLSTLTSGTGLSSNQAQDGTSQYVLSMGKLLSLDNSIAALYPRTTVTTISSVLASILPTGGYASKFAKGPGATIYLVDGGTKHGIASLGLLMAYSSDAASTVTQFSDSELAQIPNGSAVTTRFAYNNTDASKQYYISSGTHATTATFGVAGYGFAISPAGLALFGQAKEPISCTQGLIQAQGSAGIYVLDNGVRRAIGSLNILSLIKNSAGNVCVLSPEDVAAMPLGTPISTFVSNGGINYLLDQNTRFTVTTAMATAIGAAEFVPVTATLLANYAEGGELTPNFKAGNYYVLTDAGVYHATTNPTIAKLWGLTDALQPHSADVLKFIVRGNDLSQYARSSDITVATIYLVDAGKFLPISALDHLFNAGLSSQPVTLVNTNILTANLGSSWQGYLASDSSAGTLYLLEGGKKHLIPPSLTSSWVGSSTPIVPTPLSPDFLSLLNTGSVATKSVETGAPGIYGIDNGKKAGIPNIKTYNALYAPSMVVTQQLINSIPYGPLITSQ